MEPVTTTAMISAIVGYMAKTFSDSKSFKDFTNDFSSAVVDWIKPLFLKEDDSPKEVLEKLQKTPASETKQEAVCAHIKSDLEDNPMNIAFLKTMYDKIKEKERNGESITITNSRSFVLGDINTQGGSVILGDNSKIIDRGTK